MNNSDNSANFAVLFNKLRLKCGFETLGDFGNELAKEGFVYEDGIFSKWKRGERIPKDRKVLLAILRVFIKNKGISTIDEANTMLQLVDQRDLNAEEKDEVAHSLLTISKPFSEYKAINEPYSFANTSHLTESELKFVFLNDIRDLKLKEYWRYQVMCTVACYYSKLSENKYSPEHFFNNISEDERMFNQWTDYLIAIIENKETGQQVIAGCVKYIKNSISAGYELEFSKFFGRSKPWPHQELGIQIEEVGELDQFIILNWALFMINEIVGKGFRIFQERIENDSIKIIYTTTSLYIRELMNTLGISYRIVDCTYIYGRQPDAEINHPLAYEDYRELSLFWKSEPEVCIIG